jgi:hypothetical protein
VITNVDFEQYCTIQVSYIMVIMYVCKAFADLYHRQHLSTQGSPILLPVS